MSKDKADIGSRDKNGIKKESTSKQLRNRENSTDRTIVNERKGLKRNESITSKDTKKTITRNNSITKDIKSDRSSKNTTSVASSSSRLSDVSKRKSNVITSSRSNVNLSSNRDSVSNKKVDKDRLNVPSSSSSKINLTKTQNVSSQLKSKSEVHSSSKNQKVPLKSTKSPSGDVISSRVTKEKYFPKKYQYSSHLYENKLKENTDHSNNESLSSRKNSDSSSIDNKVDNGSKDRRLKTNDSAKTEDPPKLTRQRTMTRILSPSEVKIVKDLTKNKEDNKKVRPRTATIKKSRTDASNDSSLSEMTDSSIQNSKASVLKNKSKTPIHSSPKHIINKPNYNHSEKENLSININTSNFEVKPSTSKHDTNEDISDDYEDDFESYESDFEEYKSSDDTPSDIDTDTSSSSSSSENIELITQKRINSADTDEEKKLDSGTYDLPELKHKQVLDKIKEAIEKENLEINKKYNNEQPSNLASLSDEGFDEKFSGNNGFINFNDTRKKLGKKTNTKYKKRGDDLMNMIRLDAVNYNLFDAKAISYDEFMQSYGRSGTLQVSCQTGDDNPSEEIQTDEIKYTNRWTQYPVRSSNNMQQYISYNHIGVGEDPPVIKTIEENQTEDIKKLEKFIKRSGELMLTLLERKNSDFSKHVFKNDRVIPFSDGYFKLNIESCPFLAGRPVVHITFSDNSMLLTVHKSNTEVYMNADEQLLSRSTICVWNLLEPLHPEKILVSSGEVIRSCFDNKHGYLIFAGIKDGGVNVWDLRESSQLHRSVYEEKLDTMFTMRCPTYTTTAFQDFEHNNYEIVSIQPLCHNFPEETPETSNNKEVISLQVCTLDESGIVKIWSVIQRQNFSNIILEDQGLVPWGSVVLVPGITISLQELNPELKELQCFDLQCSNTDSNNLYIASNYGVLHCLSSGMKPKPKVYVAQTDASKSVTCVEMCPFSSVHFLAGSSNGNIRLHSRFYEKSLINLQSADEDGSLENGIDIIQWSKSRPCVFYIKDSSNYVHIWDLLSSDMFPIYSIPFREDITSIKMSPIQKGNNNTYMAISTKRGNVYLHTINNKFGIRPIEQYTVELKTFLNYVNRL